MWQKERPTEEGWYFWRKTKLMVDPWKWEAYFISNEGSEAEPDMRCWANVGVEVHWPTGGWWNRIAIPGQIPE